MIKLGDFYHYTDINGLLGIVNNKCLWASSPLFMNDGMEVKEGLAEVKKFLYKYFPNKIFRQTAFPQIFYLLNNKAYFDENLKNVTISQLEFSEFITSFSGLKDDLSQWRAYGADGYGYCIKFKRKHEHLQLEHNDDYCITNVVYNNNDRGNILEMLKLPTDDNTYDGGVIKKVNGILDVVKKRYNNEFKNGETTGSVIGYVNKDHLLSLLNTFLISYIFSRKHTSFKAENEYRIIRTADIKKVKYRPSKKGMAIPYIELPLKMQGDDGTQLIEEIIVGPNIDYIQARHMITSLFTSNGLKVPFITRSKVPYIS